MSTPDSSLVHAALAGDAASVEALVLRYERRAYAVALAIGLKTAEPDDVVQESFLQAIRKLPTLRRPAKFGAWFLQIVRNTARRHARPGRVNLSPNLDAEIAREAASLESRELEQLLWRRVKRLPEHVREAIFLYYYEAESVRAVADAMGVSEEVVKKRLQRGRDLLRKDLWRLFEEEVRGRVPSSTGWARRGRRLALLLLSAPAVSAPLLGASAASSRAVSATSGVSIPATLGGILMTKKLLASGALAIVLLLLGLLAIRGLLERDQPALPNERAPSVAVVENTSPDIAPAIIDAVEDGGEGTQAGEAAVAAEEVPAVVRSGTVLGPDGDPVAGARVVAATGVFPKVRTLADATTDGDGRFELEIPDATPVRLWAFEESVGLGFSAEALSETSGLTVELGPLSGVSGLIFDQETGLGIPGQRVALVRFETSGVSREEELSYYAAADLFPGVLTRRGTVVSDERGHYSFRLVGPLRFRYGFDPGESGNYVLPGFQSGVSPPEIRLEPGEMRKNVDIGLQPGSSISGRVLDVEGAPVAGAYVELLPSYRARWAITTKSDDDGRYRFGNLARGARYVVYASHPDHAPGHTAELSMVTSRDIEDVDVELTTGRSVQGRLVEEDGMPLAGIAVDIVQDIRPRAPRKGHGRVETDEDGSFVFENLAPGTHGIRPRAGNREPVGSLAFTVPEDRDLTGLEFVMRPRAEKTGFIAGHVVDARTGEPLLQIAVWVWLDQPYRYQLSAPDGSFRVDMLPERETFKVSTYHRDYWSYAVRGVPINTSDLIVEVTPRGFINGRVLVAGTREPVEQYEVKAVSFREPPDGQPHEYGTPWKAIDSPDGTFRLDRIEPIENVIHVRARGYLPASSQRLAVAPGETVEGIEILVEPGATLRGTVVDAATGEPLPMAHVRAHRSESYARWLVDFTSGSYSRDGALELVLTEREGRFELAGLRPDARLHVTVFKKGYAPVTRRDVAVADAWQGLWIPLKAEARLTLDARFTPRQDELYQFFVLRREETPWSHAFFDVATADQPGPVEFSGLPAGKYRVAVFRRREAGGRRRDTLVGDVTVSVEAGQNRRLPIDVDALAHRFGSIGGTVTAARDLSRVELRILSKSDPDETYTAGAIRCEPDGSFRFTGLPAGGYEITATDQARNPPATVRLSVRVAEREHGNVELTFE